MFKITQRTDHPFDIPNPDPALYGGKGAGLLSMASLCDHNILVPEALIITTDVWGFYKEYSALPPELSAEVGALLDKYPDALFSVRSGAPVSMPGMMDTILNVGASYTDIITGAYERFVTGWLTIVKGHDKTRIKDLITECDRRSNTYGTFSNHLLKRVMEKATNTDIPATRIEQIMDCITAVFDSWDTPRAKAYRTMHNISEEMGTACIVQRMVMGTAEGLSGSGVMFSSDPATGDAGMVGEIGWNCQGEEIVSGEITPINLKSLKDTHVDFAHAELENVSSILETYYHDVQDIEFTYESGMLYILQTRTAKMSAKARIVSACRFAKTSPHPLTYLRMKLTRAMVQNSNVSTVETSDKPIATGLAASPSAFTGRVVTRETPMSQIDKTCILVCEETAPDDFPRMAACGAILTKTGGFTCHSAVVARGIGVSAVVGCDALKFTSDTISLVHGEGHDVTFLLPTTTLTIDGGTGGIWLDEKPISDGEGNAELYELLQNSCDDLDTEDTLYVLDGTKAKYAALTLDPFDTDQMMSQADVAFNRNANIPDSDTAFYIPTIGFGEDFIATTPTTAYGPLVTYFGGQLGDHIIFVKGDADLQCSLTNMIGGKLPTPKEKIIDLLDLLEVK